MVINFSRRRDEAYRAARRGERQDKIEEKRGGTRDGMREEVCVCREKVAQLCLLFTADTLCRRRRRRRR